MKDWPTKKLGELEDEGIIKLGRGNVISKKDLIEIPGSYPVYSASRLNQGEFGKYGKYMFDEELITWSVDGGGNFFYRPKHKFSVTNVCGWLRIIKREVLSYKYLYSVLYFLHSKLYFDYIFKAHPSVIREKYKIPLPPLKIQKQIVARIEEFFEKIDKAEELREKAKEEAEQIFQSALYQIFDKAEKKWGSKKLGEICDKIKQNHPKNIFEHKFNYIDITSIDSLSKFISNTRKIPVDKAPHRARKLLKRGDTIFATTRPYLKNIAYISKIFNNYIASTGFCVIRPKKTIADTVYIFYIVNSENFVSQVLPFQRGASYPAVSDSNVYNCKIPLPPLSEQKKIVAYINNLRQKVNKLKKIQKEQLKDLEELKKSILDKVFKGELI